MKILNVLLKDLNKIFLLLIPHVLFTPSALVDQLSKKIGSVVFSKNHFKQFIRIKTKPINPRSAAQTAQRNLVSSNSKDWKNLTQAQILGWNALAGQIIKSNRLGVKSSMTGENLYVACNNNIATSGGTIISTPPSLGANVINNLLGIAITCVAGVISMAYTAGALATDIVEISASEAMSAGRTYNSAFKKLGTFASNAVSPQSLTAMYTSIYGTAPAAGAVVFFKIRTIDQLTGFASLPEKIRVLAS